MSNHHIKIWDTVARARREIASARTNFETRKKKAADAMGRKRAKDRVLVNPPISCTGLGLRPLPQLPCPDCNVEMRLLGIEPDDDDRDLRDTYTFECTRCGRLEVRSVRLK